ncbi:MAG: CPBP family intramembrane glutamic endopeptidase [Erysipelotrichaceae bacterium]|nr:CPBP family intramembrane glutamic endopeptidase [Erysipelotrichaceae bacterium]
MQRLFNKYIILTCFIFFLLAMAVPWFMLKPVVSQLGVMWGDILRYTCGALLTILLMRLFWHRTIFPTGNPAFIKNLFTFGLLGLIGAVGAAIFSYNSLDQTGSFFTIAGFILLNLSIAVCEELLFRGLILHSLLLRLGKDKRHVMQAVGWTSLIFGLRHFLTLADTPDLIVMTGAQVVFTFMASVYLCAVYLRTDNLWLVIFIHFIEDLAATIWTVFSSVAATAAMTDISAGVALRLVIFQLIYLIFGWLMLRDKSWDYDPAADQLKTGS